MLLTIKFGGETVGNGQRIRNVAKFLKNRKDQGDNFIVVTSAMVGDTDELVSIAQETIKSEDEDVKEFLAGISEKHINACKKSIEDENIC